MRSQALTRHGRRARRTLLALVIAAVAAAALAASGALGGNPVNPDRRASDLELGADVAYAHGPKAHRATSAVARYDAAVRRRCANARYRLAHRTTCPSTKVYGAARRAALARSLQGHRSFAIDSPSTMGQWGAPFPTAGQTQTPAVPVHAILLPTGKILMFGPTTPRSGNESTAFVMDPVTKAITEVPPPIDPNTGKRYNLWCAGQTLLANGTVLVAGGNLAYQDSSNSDPIGPGNPAGWKGLNRLFTFNPWTNKWTDQGAMDRGRWYPTVVTLADGRALIYGGWDETGTNTYARNILLFSPNPTSIDGKGTTQVKTSTINPGLYPRLTVLADGDVLMAGPRESDYRVLDTTTWTWGSKPSNTFSRRYWGSEVLMPYGPAGPSRIMRIGGANASNTAQATDTPFVNLASLSSGEQAGPPMTTARAHLNAVLLPDDAILAVGGGLGDGSGVGLDGGTGLYAGTVFTSELYNPQTNSWSLAATQAEPRTYHSIALLLPDGTVLSGGDDRNAVAATNTDVLEVYSPPYLFKGARPALSAAPSAIGYGGSFTVSSPDAASVTKAVLIRAGAVTHAFDNDQRSITLAQTPVAGGLSLSAPANPNLAPPGYYLLFLVNSQGVPSAARFINVGGSGPPAGVPPTGQPPAVPPKTGPGTPPTTNAVRGPKIVRFHLKLRRGRASVVFSTDRAGRATVTRCRILKTGKPARGKACKKAAVRRVNRTTFRADLGALAPGRYRLTHVLNGALGGRRVVVRNVTIPR